MRTSRAVLVVAVVLFVTAMAVKHRLSRASHVDAWIAKWQDGHAGAISVTYDSGIPLAPTDRRVQHFIVSKGLHLDYEVVTANYATFPELAAYLRRKLLPRGFGFFGHGHRHLDHDRLSYEEALASFRDCYQTLRDLGVEPVAYAYPYGAGWKRDTRRALAASGFLSGRMHDERARRNPFIVPDPIETPRNWYRLPTLVMQDRRFAGCDECVDGTAELIPFLDGALQRHAWLILTYHGIGDESQWGWYPMSDFRSDMNAIAKRDFWNASLDAITLYVRERNAARLTVSSDATAGVTHHIRIELSDALPPAIYHQPLTVMLRVPAEWIGTPLVVTHRAALLERIETGSAELKLSLVPDADPYDLRPAPAASPSS